MLKLTKKADYGLIALRHLAVKAPGGTATAKEIATAYGLPRPLLAKVLQKLSRSGFVTALPGSNGGYRLKRDPRTITALQVIRSLDGPVQLTSCLRPRGGCGQSGTCTVREPLRQVHESIMELLAGVTISGMSKDQSRRATSDAPEHALAVL
jgi:Rrf2 family protein